MFYFLIFATLVIHGALLYNLDNICVHESEYPCCGLSQTMNYATHSCCTCHIAHLASTLTVIIDWYSTDIGLQPRYQSLDCVHV